MHSVLALLVLSAVAAAQGPPPLPPQGPAAPAPPQGPAQGPAAPSTHLGIPIPGPDQGAPAPQTTSSQGNLAPLTDGDIHRIDNDDIPQQCWTACQPLLDLTRRCHDTHDVEGPDTVNDEAAERNCVCGAQDIPNQVSQCGNCLGGTGQGVVGDDRGGKGRKGPERVFDIARACNVAVAGASGASGAMGAVPPGLTPPPGSMGQASQGALTYVCQIDDDNDGRGRHLDRCRAFSGSAALSGYSCDGPLGCTTTYVSAGGALPTGVPGIGTGTNPMGLSAPTGNQPFMQNPPGTSGGVAPPPGINAAARLPVTGAAALALMSLALFL